MESTIRRTAPWPARVIVLVLMAQEIYRVSLAFRGLDNQLVVDAARRLLDGVSPYESVRFLYPPSSVPFALALTPLSDDRLVQLFPWGLGLLLLGGWWAALRMFGLPFFSWLGVAGIAMFAVFNPAVSVIQLGNWTGVVAPLMCVALLLMSRDRWLLAGLAIGLSIAIKPMLVPIGLVFLLARRWSGFAAAAGLPMAICAAVLPFLPRPGLFFTKTLPFLLHGQDNYTKLSDSSLPTMLPRLGLDGWPVTAIRLLVLILAIAAAVLRWRRGGDERLRLVETSALLMIGAFLVSTPTFGFYPLVIIPALVASVVVPGSVARSVWFWIAAIPLMVPVKFYRLDFATSHVTSQMQAYKPFVWLLGVGALLLFRLRPVAGAPESAPLVPRQRPPVESRAAADLPGDGGAGEERDRQQHGRRTPAREGGRGGEPGDRVEHDDERLRAVPAGRSLGGPVDQLAGDHAQPGPRAGDVGGGPDR